MKKIEVGLAFEVSLKILFIWPLRTSTTHLVLVIMRTSFASSVRNWFSLRSNNDGILVIRPMACNIWRESRHQRSTIVISPSWNRSLIPLTFLLSSFKSLRASLLAASEKYGPLRTRMKPSGATIIDGFTRCLCLWIQNDWQRALKQEHFSISR